MYDVFGLGNALVDTEVNVEDNFLDQQNIAKGHMTLIDSARMTELSAALAAQPKNRCSGGSAANTIYAVQGFGLKTTYACKVADDETGHFFVNELRQAGIEINTNAVSDQGRSGECFIMITDDAERTMNTDLGISSALSVDDVDSSALSQANYFYVEGYLSSSENSTSAAVHCREVAQAANVPVAVSLSDPSMVEFFRQPLETILGNGVHTIFCNEEEALSWAKTDRLDIAINELKDIGQEVYVTIGAKGSIAISKNGQQTTDGVAVKAIDTTGAGDIYAGAVIAARLKDADPRTAARFGNHCASHIVSRYGARLTSLNDYQALQASYN